MSMDPPEVRLISEEHGHEITVTFVIRIADPIEAVNVVNQSLDALIEGASVLADYSTEDARPITIEEYEDGVCDVTEGHKPRQMVEFEPTCNRCNPSGTGGDGLCDDCYYDINGEPPES